MSEGGGPADGTRDTQKKGEKERKKKERGEEEEERKESPLFHALLMSKAGYVLHGTGGVDGSMREGQVRRSQLKHASAQLKKQSHGGKSTLTLDARIAEKQLKEDATKHLRKQRMMDPSFWCAPGVEEEKEERVGCAAEGEGGAEVEAPMEGEPEEEEFAERREMQGGEEVRADGGGGSSSSGSGPTPRVVVSGDDLTRLLSQARGTTLGLGRKLVVSLGAPKREQQQQDQRQQEQTTN